MPRAFVWSTAVATRDCRRRTLSEFQVDEAARPLPKRPDWSGRSLGPVIGLFIMQTFAVRRRWIDCRFGVQVETSWSWVRVPSVTDSQDGGCSSVGRARNSLAITSSIHFKIVLTAGSESMEHIARRKSWVHLSSAWQLAAAEKTIVPEFSQEWSSDRHFVGTS